MRRVLRWLAYGLGGVAALAVLAVLVLYALSERLLRRTYTTPQSSGAFTVPTDSAAVAEGRRLAIVRGCNGCHGTGLEGRVLVDEPLLGRLVAPNLTSAARRYSDAELERLIRYGVRPDGRSLLAMPSEMFRPLSDEDLGRIVAFLRSVPPAEGPGLSLRIGPIGRLGLLSGRFQPAAVLAMGDTAVPPRVAPPGDSVAFGRYLALTSCSECHGADLLGDATTPSLAVAAAYTPAEFHTFLRTGEAKGGRELRLMSDMARRRFSQLRDAEVEMLHRYLRTLATPSAP